MNHLQPLDKKLRSQLENTVKKARDIAEEAALAVLEQLGVGEKTKPSYLDDKQQKANFTNEINESNIKSYKYFIQNSSFILDFTKEIINRLLSYMDYRNFNLLPNSIKSFRNVKQINKSEIKILTALYMLDPTQIGSNIMNNLKIYFNCFVDNLKNNESIILPLYHKLFSLLQHKNKIYPPL